MIISFGGIGLGIVWGYLLGRFDSEVARPLVVWPSLLFATLLLTAEVYLLAGQRTAVYFLLAMLAGIFFHTQWRKELRARAIQT